MFLNKSLPQNLRFILRKWTKTVINSLAIFFRWLMRLLLLFRDSADDTDGAQKIARHRSFYDNVPSPTPRKNESSDGRQRGDSHQMSGTVLYAPRVEDNVLGRHFGYFDGVIGSNDSRIRHTDVQVIVSIDISVSHGFRILTCCFFQAHILIDST